MRLTTAVLLLLNECLIFAPDASGMTVVENQQLTCPLGMCADLLNNLEAMETRLNALENRLTDSEAQIEELQKETRDRTKVAFSASLGSDGFFGPVHTDTTLVYKNVLMNVGDAYNQATGIFTAPVQGVYFFSVFYHCSDTHETMLDLYRNRKREAVTAHHKNSGSAENGSIGLTLLLEEGDQVYISLRKHSWIWDSNAYRVAVFSGFLIDAM